jgi:formamidopyrimidine-DNA glycosylase
VPLRGPGSLARFARLRAVPEVLEVELTRRGMLGLVGEQVIRVERTDPLVVAEGVDAMVRGATITGFDRRGKQLVLVSDGPSVGVHLGMTGRVLLDDVSTIGELAYGSRDDRPEWDRWALAFRTGRRLRLHDPRRLARVVLDPDLDRLGPDALTIRRVDLVDALRRRRAPLKAVLLDQHAIAGLGNMIVDEVLWWAGLDPHRVAGDLTEEQVRNLHAHLRRRLPVMLRRGGSHTGTLSPSVRMNLDSCPRDGHPLTRSVVGGRTTVWCPHHQR